MNETLLGVDQVLPGTQAGGGGRRPWHAQTSDGQRLQLFPKQNGEDTTNLTKAKHKLYIMCKLVMG